MSFHSMVMEALPVGFLLLVGVCFFEWCGRSQDKETERQVALWESRYRALQRDRDIEFDRRKKERDEEAERKNRERQGEFEKQLEAIKNIAEAKKNRITPTEQGSQVSTQAETVVTERVFHLPDEYAHERVVEAVISNAEHHHQASVPLGDLEIEGVYTSDDDAVH